MTVSRHLASILMLALLAAPAAGTQAADPVGTNETSASQALLNRLGKGQHDRDPQNVLALHSDGSASNAQRGGAPQFDERTSMHLDLAGQPPTDNSQKRLALGDFNNDGVEDILVLRWNTSAQLFLNVGGVLTLQAGMFETAADANNAHHAAVLDANDDGWLDLVMRNKLLVNRKNDAGDNWLGFATGQTISGAQLNPFTLLAADFDNDGDTDVASAPGQRMLVNDGTGVLSHDGSRMGANTLRDVIKVQARDFDGDGDIDMAGPDVSEDRHYVYFNDGSGGFPDANRLSLPLDTLTYVQVGADFNNDGIADFRIYADGANPRAFMSNGSFNGIFPEYVRRVDPPIAGDQGKHGLSHIRDIDGDGDLDFVLSSIELFINEFRLQNESSNIVINDGVHGGTFTSVFDSQWGTEESFDIKMIDVNGDGNLDLFIAHSLRLAVYINGAAPQIITLDSHTSAPSPVNAQANMSVVATGGSSPSFTWDFGDGSAAEVTAVPAATHPYTAPGRYQVTVTAQSGAASDSLVFFHTVFEPQTTTLPKNSGSIAYENTGADNAAHRAWVVNADHNTVSVVRLGDGMLVDSIDVGDKPSSLAFGGDGNVYAVNKNAATISIIDPTTLTVIDTFSDLARGSQPHGIVFSPSGNTQVAFITLEGTGQIARVDFSDDTMLVQDVGPTPRDLSISADGASVYVSRFITAPVPGESTRNLGTGGGGSVWLLDSATLTVQSTIALPYNDQPDDVFSARGIPNYLMAPTISPSGQFAFVPASSSNIYRGQFRDGQDREHNMLVRSMLAQLDLNTNSEIISARHDFDNSAQATSGAFDPTGNYLYLVFENSRVLRVYDIYAGTSLASVDLGFAPIGVVVSPDGNRVIAHNWLSRSLSVIDASGFVAGVSNEHTLLDEYTTITAEVLPGVVLRGKRLFFDSADPRVTAQSYIACSTCHADGGHDGRTWDFSDVGEGLRNTADLRARAGVGHGNVHWTANFDEIQDFENDMRDIFQGEGLMRDTDFAVTASTLGAPKAGLSVDLDALAAFVSTLATTGSSPHRQPSGDLTSEAVAGMQLFQSANCATCHSGTEFTNSINGGLFSDIGTVDADTGGRLGQPLVDGGLDTPTLKGLWNTAPYLHDGSAPTLHDAVLAHTSAAVGFDVGTLTASELDQLVAFLLQIEDGTFIDDADGDGVIDNLDNCTLLANPGQLDSDGDGYGNACDSDLNNDSVINAIDLGLIKAAFFTTGPDADFNDDGVVNAIDLGIMKASFFGAPGPSALVP